MIRARATGFTLQVALAACVVWLAAPVPVQAGMIDINLTGFRVDYSTDNDQLHDRVDDDGGNLDPLEAVGLTGTEFMFDDGLVTQYSASMGQQTYGDLLVDNITPTLTLPTLGSPASISTGDNNGAFGFDWFYDDGGTLRNLRLNFEEVIVGLIYNGNMIRPTLVVTGSTTNWMQSNLPGGLTFNPGSEISFSYTTSNTMAFGVSEENFTDLLAMGGVMQISGEGEIIVPEPPTGMLALSALCVLVVVSRLQPAGQRRLSESMIDYVRNRSRRSLCPVNVRHELPRQEQSGQDGTYSHIIS